MRIRHLKIERFRGIKDLSFSPGPKTVILGPNNSGKTTVLEALDLLLHSGRGRSRPPPSETDYFGRNPDAEFSIEAVLGDVPDDFASEAPGAFEGWSSTEQRLVPEIEGEGLEPVVRVRVRGTSEFDLRHEFAKEELDGKYFGPAFRSKVAWIFDGRLRDPSHQLGFYQGGLLDRLFERDDVSSALAMLREALDQGAGQVSSDATVAARLEELAVDLRNLGLIAPAESPLFEVGSVSRRELLQSLRLSLPEAGTTIPLARHGRGAQRLLLVAVLLRLAKDLGRPVIGGFEEPEEALEPMRQLQVARLIAELADSHGQVFVVTHSPEIARSFAIEDFVLMDERSAGHETKVLRVTLDRTVCEKYERWLDGAVVRGLFARIPVLVEGPSDRAVLDVFWNALASQSASVARREKLGLDFVNAEGFGQFRTFARLLNQSGKPVVAFVEGDQPTTLTELRSDGTCAVIVWSEAAEGQRTLEQLIARAATLPALIQSLAALAADRGVDWDRQREFLVSSLAGIDQAIRDQIKRSSDLVEALGHLPDEEARNLIARLLESKGADAPFSLKGGRPGRIFAEKIVALDGGVPAPFVRALTALSSWAAAEPRANLEIHLRAP